MPRTVEIEREARIEEMQRRVDEGRDPHTGEKYPGVGPGLLPITIPKRKTCNVCKRQRLLRHFPEYAPMRDGHLNVCQDCQNAGRRKRWHANQAKKKEKP